VTFHQDLGPNILPEKSSYRCLPGEEAYDDVGAYELQRTILRGLRRMCDRQIRGLVRQVMSSTASLRRFGYAPGSKHASRQGTDGRAHNSTFFRALVDSHGFRRVDDRVGPHCLCDRA
jgi:hypothetical protein